MYIEENGWMLELIFDLSSQAIDPNDQSVVSYSLFR